jgi:hypothetical protein
LQCGYCTPGILMTLTAFLKENPAPTEHEVREALSGNLCRCTGYQNIVDAALLAAKRIGEVENSPSPPTPLPLGEGSGPGASSAAPSPGGRGRRDGAG